MAQFETPVKVKRGDDVREAANDTQLNQLLWDGFLVQDGEKAEPVKATRRTAAKASEDTRTPQQKAADTRKAKKAAAAAEAGDTAGDTSSEASTVDSSAVSGDSAAGESTVGSNPS